MNFEFATANRIIFGMGKLTEAAPAARTWGRRALIVHSPNTPGVKKLAEALAHEGVTHETWVISGEPEVNDILEGLGLLKEAGSQVVIGLGGGSVLDAAKAIAGLFSNPGDPLDYLEVIGKGLPLKQPALPLIAIPTTAGTGSEVTRNAVLTVREMNSKVSLRSPFLLPRLAIVDPELTVSLPPVMTAATGMDALTQLIEPFVSRKANAMADLYCLEGIRRVKRSLVTVFMDGSNAGGREDMAFASLLGGLALTNAGLGAVHGLAGPLGGRFGIGHGLLCARLLPAVVRVNIMAMTERAPRHIALRQFAQIAALLTGKATAGAEESVEVLNQLIRVLMIPRLGEMGVTPEDFDGIIEKAISASSMQSNPIALEAKELRLILEEAF
jgi:alcohol dehydrogenase class IV